MEPIKTFVFFDLETTGLPQNSPVRITEIALISASREEISEKSIGVSKENGIMDRYLPRVLNKLNLLIYPCKMIHPSASYVSGLTNENLEKQKPFDENAFNILHMFIERLERPVCLVAHNGNKFDFPILQSELNKIGKEFSEDVYCVDSLPGFREVIVPREAPQTTCKQSSDISNDIRPLDFPEKTAASLLPKCGWSNDDYNEELVQVTEVASQISIESPNAKLEELEKKIMLEMEKRRKINETTPERRKPAVVPSNNERVRRKILNEVPQPKLRFNMSALYKMLTHKELVDAHRAESDALALLECVTVLGQPMLEWMDSNRIPFRSIKKIW